MSEKGPRVQVCVIALWVFDSDCVLVQEATGQPGRKPGGLYGLIASQGAAGMGQLAGKAGETGVFHGSQLSKCQISNTHQILVRPKIYSVLTSW